MSEPIVFHRDDKGNVFVHHPFPEETEISAEMLVRSVDGVVRATFEINLNNGHAEYELTEFIGHSFKARLLATSGPYWPDGRCIQ